MAKLKPNPTVRSGSSRRDKLASFEAARRREQRRRTLGLLAICLVLAVGLLSYPVYLFAEDYRARHATLEDIGTSLTAAGCDPVSETPATGNQDHVPDGTKVPYDVVPPASGPHYAEPAPFTKRFYTPEDRPPVETLVHNLEHGYLVAWYRDSISEDERDNLERIAKTFDNEEYNPQDKFIAAPWREADGAGFPAGKNVVLARWFADPANPGSTNLQKSVRQACAAVSGAAIQDFQNKYPVTSSPEPNGA